MSVLLMIAAMGRPIFMLIAAASFKSLSPIGVGSVTNTTRSAPFTESTTGQEVPGGASMMAIVSSEISFLVALIKGGDFASP